jgi:Tfp pilus assembly protein PilF
MILGGTLLVVTLGYFTLKPPRVVPHQPGAEVQGHSDMQNIENIQEILQNLPDDYTSLVALGHQYMDQHNYSLAAECYKRALDLEEDSLDVRIDYGACLHSMGLPQRAIGEFQRVLEADPTHPIATFNVGIVYYDLKELDSARFYWQRAIELDPNGRAAAAARQLLKEIDG